MILSDLREYLQFARWISLLMLSMSLVSGCAKPDQASDDVDGGSKAKDTDIKETAGVDWIEVRPGTFTMGSSLNELGHQYNERQVDVTLTHGFQMAATEITWQQWQNLGLDMPAKLDSGITCMDSDCPVVFADSDEVERWLNTLSERNGLDKCYGPDVNFLTPYHCPGYRLPTEAEWEYAARAQTETATYAGDLQLLDEEMLVDSSIAWCGESFENFDDSRNKLLPVGGKAPNPWGFYDMLGNAKEMTEWLGILPAEAVTNPVGPTSDYVALRGGGRFSEYRECRAAYRQRRARLESAIWNKSLGFRPVRTLPDSVLADPDPPSEDPCPPFVSYQCPMDLISSPLVSAALVGEGAKFVDILTDKERDEQSKTVILGELTTSEGTRPFLLVVDLVNRSNYTVNFPAEGIAATRAVALAASVAGRSTVVLCDDKGGCLLAESDATALIPKELTPVEGGVLPKGLIPVDATQSSAVIEVVGDGGARFEHGVWTVWSPPKGEAVLRSVRIETAQVKAPRTVAAGDGGRIVQWDGKSLSELSSGTTENLRDIYILDTDPYDASLSTPLQIVAVGDDGTMVKGSTDALFSCHIADEALVSVGLVQDRCYSEDEQLFLMTESGRLINWHHTPLADIPICYQDQPIINAQQMLIYQGGALTNLLWLTQGGLFGNFEIVIE